MDVKEFKSTVASVLKQLGFLVKDKRFYRKSDDLLIVVEYQKSSWSEAYYLEVGFIVVVLQSEHSRMRSVDGHLRTRLAIPIDGKATDLLEYQALSNPFFEVSLVDACRRELGDVRTIEDLRGIIESVPNMKYGANVVLKNYLGMTG